MDALTQYAQVRLRTAKSFTSMAIAYEFSQDWELEELDRVARKTLGFHQKHPVTPLVDNHAIEQLRRANISYIPMDSNGRRYIRKTAGKKVTLLREEIRLRWNEHTGIVVVRAHGPDTLAVHECIQTCSRRIAVAGFHPVPSKRENLEHLI